MKLFIEITLAIVTGEWLYTWLTAFQSMIIGRYLKRKYRDALMQKHLEQMPVGRAN